MQYLKSSNARKSLDIVAFEILSFSRYSRLTAFPLLFKYVWKPPCLWTCVTTQTPCTGILFVNHTLPRHLQHSCCWLCNPFPHSEILHTAPFSETYHTPESNGNWGILIWIGSMCISTYLSRLQPMYHIVALITCDNGTFTYSFKN